MSDTQQAQIPESIGDKFVSLKLARENNGSITFEVESKTDDVELNAIIRGFVELFADMAQDCFDKGIEVFMSQIEEAQKNISKDGDIKDMPVLGQA